MEELLKNEKQMESLAKHILLHLAPVTKLAIDSAIQEKVNGKVDKLSSELKDFTEKQSRTNEGQDKMLESLSKGQMLHTEATNYLSVSLKEVKNDVKDVVELYRGSSGFFRAMKTVFVYVTAFATAIGSALFIHDKLIK